MHNKAFFLGFLFCGFINAVSAVERDSQQTIEIEADKMMLDEPGGTMQYEGNVRLTQGSIMISADKLIVTSSNRKLQRMQIVGNDKKPAMFQQKTVSGQLASGQAQRMDFDVVKSLLILSGHAELKQGSRFVRSERIEYNTTSNSLLAGKQTDKTAGDSNAGRVHIVITPEQK
ncbi:MAG: lipopolysaccharide transport periplasmic protein LptA [Gammaproteobacteria bacterium]|nr:lipopolysaccharide transport periplasmic protein LptA [Gammaproteobacteria bacterium]